MTSSLRSSAPRAWALAAALAALAAGCGEKDGAADYEAGVKAYESGDLKQAAECLCESLKLTPDRADAWVMLARTRLDMEDFPGAEEAVAKAAELAPGDADVLELSAQVAYRAKNPDYEKAMECYAKMAESSDPAVQSRGFCGYAVVAMTVPSKDVEERNDRVRIFLLTAMRLDGRNACARYHLGKLYREQYGYLESARDQYETFLNLEKKDAERVAKVRDKTIRSLREEIERARAQRPGVSRRDSPASASALKKAKEAFAKKSYKAAYAAFADAYQKDVLNYEAAVGAADSVLKYDTSKAGLENAFKFYKAASQIRPSYYATLVSLGKVAERLDKKAAAVEAYSRAVAAKPYDATAIAGLSDALKKSGRPRQSALYKKYLDWLTKGKK